MKNTITILILVAVLVILAATNPNKSEYVSWAKEEIIKESGNNVLAKGLVALAGESLINSNTTHKNYIFLSIYETDILNEKVQVIGILGNFIPLNGNQGNVVPKEVIPSIILTLHQ